MEFPCSRSRGHSASEAVGALQQYLSKQGSRSQSPTALPATSSCPFAPSIPQYAGISRTVRIADKMQPVGDDMADLRAALYDAGVHTQLPLHQLQHNNSNIQQANSTLRLQQLRQNMDMQHRAVSRAAATTSSADALDFNRLAEQLQERSGRLSSLQTKQQLIDAQLLSARPSRHGRSAGPGPLSDSQGLAAATANSALERPASSSSSSKATVPFKQAEVMPLLGTQLALLNERLKAASTAIAQASGSSALSSSTEQPPTPALAAHSTQKPTQPPAAFETQRLAEAGMAQLQEVTQLSQQLLQVQSAISDQAAAAQSRILELQSFFKQHPELHSAAALRSLVDENKRLRYEVYGRDQRLGATLQLMREQNNTPTDKRCAALQQEVKDLQRQLKRTNEALAASEADNRWLRSELGIGPASSRAASPAQLAVAAKLADDSLSSGVQRRLTYHAEGSLSTDSSSSSSRSVSGRHTAGDSRQQQLDEQDTPASAIKQMTVTFETALAAKEHQVQQLQQQLDELRMAAESKQQASGIMESIRGRQVRRLCHVPRTLDEAVQQIASLNEMIEKQQNQLQEQEQQASRRASECETAFKRQLEVEKKQHDCTRANCKLITEQLEQLQERFADSQVRQMQLQQQLEQVTDRAQADAPAGYVDCKSEVDHARQLQQHVQEQKQQIGQLRSCIQGLYDMMKSAGRLVSTATGHQCQQQQLQDDPVPQLLKDSIKQLLVDVAQYNTAKPGVMHSDVQAEASEAQQQQQQQLTEVTHLKRQLLQLEQKNEHLHQELQSALVVKQQCDKEVRQQAVMMQQSAERLKQMKALRDENHQLQHDVTALHAQLDKALQEQQLSASHLELCRQQLTEAKQQVSHCQTERDILMDRMRQLADRASAAELNGRVTPCSASAGEVVQLQMSEACAELNKQVSVLTRELSDREVKEERLQVVNAQLQERNAQLQEQISKLQVTADAASLIQPPQAKQCATHQQQIKQLEQQLQDHQQHLQQQDQQVQQLRQQLQQKEQQLVDLQAQQTSQAPAGDDLSPEELRAELEDRTKELFEWQIHADALEKDLVDLKERVDAADTLHDQLEQQQQQYALLAADKEELQKELEDTQDRVAHLELNLHDAGREHSALLNRFEAVKAELSRVKEAAADMKLRLEHYTGPAGPQARIKQLEASLQSAQRKYEAADSRAAHAAAEVKDLRAKLSNAEDSILSLEGQISILETELAKYTQ